MIDGNRTVAEVLRSRACTARRRQRIRRARARRVDRQALQRAVRAESAARAPCARSEDEVQRFLTAQQKISDSINAHLGFRGYLMMMRLQRASNLRDLHDLLPDFAQALVKAHGRRHRDADWSQELQRLIVHGN